jgi:hypothetical protein
VLCFETKNNGLPKVVRDYRARYRVISQVLDKNRESLDLVHQDLKKLSQGDRKRQKGDFTSENNSAGLDRAGHGRFAVS